jgi:hypothetical protein
MMAIDLTRRFHDFKTIGRVRYEGQPAVQVGVTDDLGHPTTIYFSPDSHLLLALTKTNPRAATPPMVTSRFDAWRSVNGAKLVSHVTILYGSDSFVFDFKTLTLNTADNQIFKIPKALMK